MPMKTKMEGIVPILVLPLDREGRLDVDSLQSLIDFNIDAGVHGLGIAIGSEIFKLSESERAALTAAAVKHIGGRVPFIVNVSANGTDLAIHQARAAADAGADALMVYPAAFLPVGADAMVAHFAAIAEAVPLPVILQDVPQAPISPNLALTLGELSPSLRHIKVETKPTVPHVAAMAEQAGHVMTILGGDGGSHMIEEYRRGARGTMPFCSQPGEFVRVWELLESGDPAGARAVFDARIMAVNRLAAQQADLFYHVHKQLLVRRGVIGFAAVKAPTGALDAITQAEIDELLDTVCAPP